MYATIRRRRTRDARARRIASDPPYERDLIVSGLIRVLALPALLAALAVLPTAPATAASTKNCAKAIKGKERKLGTTYVTKVRVRGVSCKTGLSVVKSFHACRHKRGKAGTCTSRVRGYRCTEKRPASLQGPVSYDGDVTCKRGSRRVTQHYQQNT